MQQDRARRHEDELGRLGELCKTLEARVDDLTAKRARLDLELAGLQDELHYITGRMRVEREALDRVRVEAPPMGPGLFRPTVTP
jgi:hypothetical protein